MRIGFTKPFQAKKTYLEMVHANLEYGLSFGAEMSLKEKPSKGKPVMSETTHRAITEI